MNGWSCPQTITAGLRTKAFRRILVVQSAEQVGCWRLLQLQLPARLILAVAVRPVRTVSATVADLVHYRYKALEIRQWFPLRGAVDWPAKKGVQQRPLSEIIRPALRHRANWNSPNTKRALQATRWAEPNARNCVYIQGWRITFKI